VALLACLLGYGEVGLWLTSEENSSWVIKGDENPYERWIDDYAGEGYQGAVRTGLGG
jgi:hydroxymethylpyrimidine/phosphomethylpyrimidine kinase / thiaminase